MSKLHHAMRGESGVNAEGIAAFDDVLITIEQLPNNDNCSFLDLTMPLNMAFMLVRFTHIALSLS